MRPDEIIKTLERAGFEARYVGGCVRDTLLNRPIHDWDIASQALPEDVIEAGADILSMVVGHDTHRDHDVIYWIKRHSPTVL